MDPVIQQIARARSIEPHFLRKMKEHLVGVVQPQLDECARLREENAALRQEVAELRSAAGVTGEPAQKSRRKAVRA